MKLTLDTSKDLGKIRAMHAVGQPPRMGISGEFMHYLTDAHIPYSRLHDVGGSYGGNMFVDIPNIFRDFSANEYDPDSYDFAFTDILLKQLNGAKCEPIYRLGVTIENYQYIKAYRVFPPTDYAKWARICEHIIKHYNEGWANGFHYGIKYWEIWNEPDNGYDLKDNQMWQGTAEEYYELYEVTSKHLKKRFGDSIKVGGFASCGFYSLFTDPTRPEYKRHQYFTDFFLGFLDFIDKTKSPLDFFSWHSYASVENTMMMADFVDTELTKHRLGDIETQCNEWNNAAPNQYRGTSYASASAADMMLAMHDKKTTIMCYYDARIGQSMYGGLFNPMTWKPLCTYYSFAAFGELYTLGKRVEVTGASGKIRAIAAHDGEKTALMIVNTGDEERIETNLSGMKVYLIDSEHFLTEEALDPTDFTLGKNQVALIKNF